MADPAGDGRVTIGSGWKMNGATVEGTRAFLRGLAAAELPPHVELFVLPPITALFAASTVLPKGSRISLGAQHAHWGSAAETTGEVSMAMARDAGASIVEMGHSERRAAFGEDDDTVNRRVLAALAADLRPLVCVGEDAEQRRTGAALDTVVRQTQAALHGVDWLGRRSVMLAYEPVWAIGENGRPAEPHEVADVCVALAELGTGQVLYGGGVAPSNVRGFVDLPGVDGVFAGRSTWTLEGLLSLISQAAQSHAEKPCPTS